MSKKTETGSINDYARQFLKLENKTLPIKLHNALNTIFTKERDNSTEATKKFRRQVVTEVKTTHGNHYEILAGKSNAIYNALCLIAIVGVGPTKKIFQYRYLEPKTGRISSLLQQTQEQALIFFCLGIDTQNMAEIANCLESNNFDLFTERLPSPFGYYQNDKFNLAPMLVFYEAKIPWQHYASRYQAAESRYAAKDMNGAILQLEALEQEALLPLPVVTSLKETIIAKQADAEEAASYLQSLLNYK
ncbi:hypothetical protein PE36_01867 [Moritella sp. PE36]|uniref:hypothetical protein n=1 Tax=Moritella sp. PE36 TaxID=58051 RepID=UPI000156845E|nr:hypothetical protein [Moritella sp. PE36]EDM68688.1 hypothetical protein PE36_01867 [Moritella sp. PE36]